MKKDPKNQKQSTTWTANNSEPGRRPSWWSWLAIGIPVIALAAVMLLGGGEDTASDSLKLSAAPDFTLPATDGSNQGLESILATGDALLYFSMGPGCDSCFHQIPEIEEALAMRGITLVPVMVNPTVRVAEETRRFGITTPVLIDIDRSVSEAYGMIGIYGHRDRPSHSFALVNQDRRITWVKHYAEMFVSIDNLLADIGAAA